MSTLIWINKDTQSILEYRATASETVNQDLKDRGYALFSTPYADRLLAGERPANYEIPVLPDRAILHSLASGSNVWNHFSMYSPINLPSFLAVLLGSSTLDQTILAGNIKDLLAMCLIELGETHSLEITPGLPKMVLSDPSDLNSEMVEVPRKMSEQLDEWLEKSYMPFRYADIKTKADQILAFMTAG